MKLSVLLFSVFIALPNVCFAELVNENLLQNLPSGYKVGFHAKQGNMVITEMVP